MRKLPVFVYGTLMNGLGNWSRYVAPYPHEVRPAKIRGDLYHLPEGYPALLQNSETESWVKGELLYFPSNIYAQAMKGLDELEDYFGEGNKDNLYERAVVEAVDASTGELSSAYVYIMADEKALLAKKRGMYVPSGDWRAFINKTNK